MIELATLLGTAIDLAGVVVIVLGALVAVLSFLRRCMVAPGEAYASFRRVLGRAILLGLEFLIAGDIVRTVVVAPSLVNAWVLAIIVLIRTFLSTTLQVELDGRWPWRREVRAERA
jgi:uncharacterized membrane protein